MTVTGSYLDTRPRLRPEIILGPGLHEGTRTVHHVKDPRTGWYFRIGEREFFVISRMDGERSMAEIGAEYAGHFGRRLGEQNWQQIMGLLVRRRLLAGSEDEESLERLTAAARAGSLGRRGLLLYRKPLVNPDRFFGRLAPRIRFVFSPFAVLPALLAVALLEVFLVWHWRPLYADLRHAGSHPVALASGIAVVWLTLALHESAHGLTCKHFGGSAPEIGVIWRFPILAPYCKADDVVLFPRRRHRVYTAFAGIFAGLVALLPFGVLWALAPAGSAARPFAAIVLLVGSLSGLANLVPFLQLDGYFMLNHALGMVNLRTESYRFWARLAGRAVGRGAGISGYPTGIRLAYLGYGAVSLLYLGSLCARVVGMGYRGLHHWLGGVESLVALAVLAGLGTALGVRSSIKLRRTGGRSGAAIAAADPGGQP